jgi:hypothetical protein
MPYKNIEERKAKQKEYAEKNKEKIAAYKKEWAEKNRKKLKEKSSKYYLDNKEKSLEYKKQYAIDNKDQISERSRLWREKNSDILRIKKREYYLKNKEKIAAYKKEWTKNNRDRINDLVSFKRNNNPKSKIDQNISNAINKHLKVNQILKDNKHWEDIVGYSFISLVKHLESKFDNNMSWENYGIYWHIDHIKPKSWFLYESIEDPAFKECWALENLQPLEAKKNISKGNRYEG